MKINTLFIITIVFVVSFGIKAQSITKLKQQGFHAVFTPNGEDVVFSTSNFSGLKVLDLEFMKIDVLSDEAGAGYGAIVQDDRVFYKTRDSKIIVNEVDFATKKKLQFNNKSISVIADSYNGISKKKSSLPVSAMPSSDLFSIKLIYSDGIVNEIVKKQGENKVWVSLSPDRTKVLYTVVGGKTIVVDLQGNVLVQLKRAEAPKWANNNEIVYMLTSDNRDYITASDIYSLNIKENKNTILTSKFDDVALYPDMSNKGDKVIFNNREGELFLITLKN